MRKKYTEEEIDFIKNNYFEKGPRYCCEKLNKSYSSIVVKAYKLKIKHDPNVFMPKIFEYNKNNCYRTNYTKYYKKFTELKDPKYIYILGLLWADGNIYVKKPRHRISITLKIDDFLSLQDIFEYCGFSCYYRKRKGKRMDQGCAMLENKALAEFLFEMGYNNRKNSACKILSKIPEKLHHYWFRGLVDGDGCFYRNKKYKNQGIFSIAGPYEQNWKYCENLFNKLQIKYYIDRNDRGISKNSCIRFSTLKNRIKISKYLYQGDQFGLKRKKDKSWLNY